MAQTEVQKIPGVFKVPSGWPKLVFPDMTTSLLADWDASDLALGTLSSLGWVPRDAVRTGSLKTASQTPAPTIMADSKGRRYVKMGTTRLSAAIDWPGPMTVLVTMRPDNAANAGSSRRVFSGPSGNFRAMYLEGTGVAATMQTNNSNTTQGKSISRPIPEGGLMVAGVRFGETVLDGFVEGHGWSSEHSSPGNPLQTEFGVGANASSPPVENSFLHGDLYRIQAWNRVLSKLDLESAVQVNARRYA